MKFCSKLGFTPSETVEKLQIAYGERSLKKTQVFMWHKRFRDGREDVKDDERQGAPATKRTPGNIERVKEVIMSDRRLTVREISSDTGLSFGTVQTILTMDLNMRRVSAKFVPRLLSSDQKENRVEACQQLKEALTEDSHYLQTVITCDESWVYGYDPETKNQSSQWKSPSSPRPKKARMSRSAIKTMLIVFFDIKGIVHSEYLPQGSTVNQYVYIDILRRLKESIRRKRPELSTPGSWKLHHDNAPAHTALRVQDFLAKHQIPVVPHPPYSPDLAPCDFWLFPRLKFHLKGKRFADVEEIKQNTNSELRALVQKDFETCFTKWQGRWDKCIRALGDYFEGDN